MARLFNDPETEDRLASEFETRRRQFQVRKQQATVDQAAAIAEVGKRYPYAEPGVQYAIAASGMPIDSPEAEELAAASGTEAVAQGQYLEPGAEVDASWFEENIWSPFKTAVRYTGTIAQGLYHEGIARPVMATLAQDEDIFGFDNPSYNPKYQGPDAWNQAYADVGDSPLVRAIKTDRSGVTPASEEEYLGSGFLPGGKLQADHRAQLDKLKAQHGGDISPGRMIATTLHMQPGGRAHALTSGLLDLAGGIALDPTGRALGVSSKVRAAQKAFGRNADIAPRTRAMLERAQIVGPRKSAVGEEVEEFLTREWSGRQLVNWLTETTDVDKVWRGLGKKVDRNTVVALADAGSADEVMGVLRGVLGDTIRTKPTVPGVRTAWRTSTFRNNIRLLGEMPGTHVDVQDLDKAMGQVDDFLNNAKVPADVRAKHVEAIARIADDDPTKASRVWGIVGQAMKDVEDALVLRGRPISRSLTTMVEDYEQELRKYFVNEIGENAIIPGKQATFTLAGREVALPRAHLLTEYADNAVPLPDARALKREVSNPVVRGVLDAADQIPLVNPASIDNFMGRVWKPVQLLRAAWVVRVIGEEQVRMGAAGMDSALRDPLSYIGWLVGQKGAKDVLGNPLKYAQEYVDAMSRGTMGFLDDMGGASVRTGDYVNVHKGDERYIAGAAGELNQLWNDELASVVAGKVVAMAGGPERPLTRAEVVNWLYSGEGRPILEKIASAPDKAEYLDNIGLVDAYVSSVWARINIKTGGSAEHLGNGAYRVTKPGDPELIEAIATGELRGEKIRWMEMATDPGHVKATRKHVGSVLSEKADVLPEMVKVPREITVRGKGGRDMARLNRHDKAINYLFNTLMSRPTNYLSRSPAFKQGYWDEMERLMPYMDQATQEAMFASAAREAGGWLPDKTLMRMRKIVDSPQAGDKITMLQVADELAKGHALHSVKDMLYDLSNKSQFADSFRVIFPFAEAFKEVMTTWAKIGTARPQNLRRVQQTVDSGFFQPDANGEEKFVYPFGSMLTSWIGGLGPDARVEMQGRASGLNMVTSSFIPGFGPAIQLPASQLIPDDEDWAWLEDIVIPFGRVDESRGAVAGTVEALLPAYMRKLITAVEANPETSTIFGNAVGDAMRALQAGGGYGPGPDEFQRLYKDARGKARALFFLRAAAQFVLPTGPEYEYSVKTDAGPEWQTFETLRDEYSAMGEDTAAGGWDTAAQRFIEKHGVDVAMVMQGKAKPMKERASSRVGIKWEQDNPDLVERYGNVIGFFAPEADVDEPEDYAAYQRLIRTGALKPLTPEQQLRLSNDRIADNVYETAKAALGDTIDDQERQLLRDLSSALKREYPGYADTFGVPDAADTETRIDELTRAAMEPALKDSETAQAIRTYTEARTLMLQTLNQSGLNSFTSVTAQPVANLLRELGDTLALEKPAFDRVWNDVFRFELGDEAVMTEVAA